MSNTANSPQLLVTGGTVTETAISGLLWKPEVLQGNWTACLNMAPCSISRCLDLTGKIAPSRRTLVNTVFPEQTTTFRCLCLQLVLEIYFCGFGPRSSCGSMFSTCKLVSIAGLGSRADFPFKFRCALDIHVMLQQPPSVSPF